MGTQFCALHLWVLTIQTPEGVQQKLLYGWVLANAALAEDRWHVGNIGKKKGLNEAPQPSSFRLTRVTYYSRGDRIIKIAQGLLRGRNLFEVCKELGIAAPDGLIRELRLGESEDDVLNQYRFRPSVILQTRQATGQKRAKGSNSPSIDANAFVASIFCLDKLRLFKVGTALPGHQALARDCLNTLELETGLRFKAEDSVRLGNLEWIVLPMLDERENPRLRSSSVTVVSDRESGARAEADPYGVSTLASAREIKVEIDGGVFSAGQQVLVRCRACNDRDIILDACRMLEGSPIEVTFRANQEVSAYTVTVWVLEGDTWNLWGEVPKSIVKDLSIVSGAVVTTGSLTSDRFEMYQNYSDPSVAARLSEVQRAERVYFETTLVGGGDFDPWRSASQKMRDLTLSLFPPRSGARFFSKGLDPSTGLLSFAEWLKSLTMDEGLGCLFIVDPYFDTAGIELVATAKVANAKYVVLTNSEVRSNDDGPERETRAERLKRSCHTNYPYLSTIDFKLYDLQRVASEKKQNPVFHDRYIFAFNGQNELAGGYHLSNSIQGATKKAPMLVTPIPTDVLGTVWHYIDDLMGTKLPDRSENQVRVEKLFDSVETQPQRDFSFAPLGSLPNPQKFFASLLAFKHLESYRLEELERYLRRRGFLSKRENHFVLPKRFRLYLVTFIQKLERAEGEFADMWNALTIWLSRSVEPEAVITELSKRPLLARRLEDHLLGISTRPLPVTGSFDASTQSRATFLKASFRGCLQPSAQHFLESFGDVRWQGGINSFEIRYAAEVLLRQQPDGFVRVLDGLTSGEAPTPAQSYVALTMTTVLSERLYMVDEPTLAQALISSNTPLLRAFSAMRYPAMYRSQPILLEAALEDLGKLDPIERLHALAEWLVQLNLVDDLSDTPDTGAHLQARLWDELRHHYVALSYEELASLVTRLSRFPHSSASAITDRFLLRLVEDNKLPYDKAAQMWLNPLFHRFEVLSKLAQSVNGPHHPLLSPIHMALITEASRLFPNTSHELQETYIKKTQKVSRAVLRLLRRPFARADREAWRDGITVGNGCIAFVGQVLEAVPSSSTEHRIGELREIQWELTTAIKLVNGENRTIVEA